MHSLAKAEDLMRVQERLAAVQAEDARRWGLMNAGQMVCHVRAAFRTATGDIPSGPIPLPLPREMVKAVALWAPLPWKQGFATVPALKLGASTMRTGDFEQDRAEAIGEMRRFVLPEQMRVDHSFFGPMSYEDWMRWGYLHTDHHLRQFGR